MKTCEECGRELSGCEIRCTECALNTLMPPSYYILAVRLSFKYKLVRGIGGAIIFSLAGIILIMLTAGFNGIIPKFISGSLLTIIHVIISIVGIILAIACFSGAYISITEIRDGSSYFFTKTKMEYNNRIDTYKSIEDVAPEETEFVQKDFSLRDVSKISITQNFIGKYLNYGDILIFTGKANKPYWIIPGIANPQEFKEKLQMLVTYLSVPFSQFKKNPDIEAIRAENLKKNKVKAFRENKLFAGRLAAVCFLAVLLMIGTGKWYRTTIPYWDECIRDNKCFVCHADVHAIESGYEDMGMNIRLCPKHSTGWQAWRRLYYLPAVIFIYEDAPHETGWFFTPLIRWFLIIIWVAVLLIGGILTIIGTIKYYSPQKFKFLDA